jgi:hypothetical protein
MILKWILNEWGGGVGWVHSVHEFAASEHGSMNGGEFCGYLSTSQFF